jgi:hypothetical protein
VTTSMITPPLSISARPDFTRNVATSFIGDSSLATGETPIRYYKAQLCS